MMDIKLNKRVEITTETTIKLIAQDIIDLLKGHGSIPEDVDSIEVLVKVPGGGDWSNMDLDINASNPLEISYKTREIE